MLTYDDALNLNYYKKTTFTGWMGKIRFLIKMEKITVSEPVPDGTPDENGSLPMIEKEIPRFHVWVWPAPYIFDLTPDAEKEEACFPFSEEGKKQAVDWINEHLD